MISICPTVLASTKEEYEQQINRVSFAPRLQLDFMDGDFAPTKSIDLKDAWWPENTLADLHLMYRKPMDYLTDINNLKPTLVIIHAEAEGDLSKFADEMHERNIKAGICLLPETSVDSVKELIPKYDHMLVFGGKLGYFGGQADLSQVKKAREAQEINPDIEVGWDGGANDKNAKELIGKGVKVLNFGGFIQKADNPKAAYELLINLVS